MRKLLLPLALSGGTLLAAQAQTTIGKGTGLLTGSVGYHADIDDISSTGSNGNNGSSNTYKTSTFKIDFAVGGFVADNLALGLQLTHAVTGGSVKSSYNSTQPGPPSSSTLRVGPMVQYYKMLSEQFGLTAMLGAGYESDKMVRQNIQYINGYPSSYYYAALDASGYYAALTPGIVFFPVPKFGLTASIGSLSYNRLKVKNTSALNSTEIASSFDAGFGFSELQFGASYYFGRK